MSQVISMSKSIEPFQTQQNRQHIAAVIKFVNWAPVVQV